MGGGAPAAPDYVGAAQQTAAGDLANLKYQTVANRPTVNTPWGSSTWTNTPQFDQAGYDAAMKAYGGNPGTWVPEQTTTGTGPNGDPITQTIPGHYEGGSAGSGGTAPDRSQFTTDNWTNNVTLTPAEQQ